MMQQKAIELARDCIGTPFRHQGRVPGLALDCAGLLVHVFNGLGLACNDVKGYPRRPYEGLLEEALLNQPNLVKVGKSDLQAGDVVLFRIKKEPQHIGIFTGSSLIHAYYATGRVVEQSFNSWKHCLTHVYRVVK